MEWTDELGRLFHCALDLLSPKEDINLDDLLGKDMTVEIDLRNGSKRYFHGYVSQMSQAGRERDHFCYSVVLHPWFWFLTQTADCRIFQEKTVPDIIKELFRDSGFSDFEDALNGTYRQWEYCVQYRETDFNFISRLMEQEGIYYYIRHESGKDVLVLCDGSNAHSPIKGYESVPYYPPSDNVLREEHIFDWRLSRSVRTGAYALNAYHFKKPRANLSVRKSISRKHAMADMEVFDFPGEYFETKEGEAYVGARIEELQTQYERVHGETDAMALFPGGLFALKEFPRKDQNREYLICSTRQRIELGSYETGESGGAMRFSCSFEALHSAQPFRAERSTPKPFVQGPQSAIVTGPAGEEIHTDEYGRIKVKFAWDRSWDDRGAPDDNSSCWVRVSQVWAGSQWGGMTIPRVGQEVIVDFIEGDPDRPIVTGRVYNDDNKPPYKLPDNKTQSGVKSRSTKEGSAENFNEIRFEDKLGEEEMYIHAEKDQTIVIENNQVILVGIEKADDGDRSLKVQNDETVEIGRNRTLTVGQDKSETIDRDKAIAVKNNHSESVANNMSINVGSNLTETVGVNYAETVGAAMELTVGGALAISVGASMQQTVGGIKTERVGASSSMQVGGNFDQKVGSNKSVNIDADYQEKVGGLYRQTVAKEAEITAKKIQLVAQEELNIKVGSAQLILKKNGDITMKGNNLNLKGSGNIVIKGSTIKEN